MNAMQANYVASRSQPAGGVNASSDDVAARYSSLADDATMSEKRREASMVVAMAEGCLNEEGDPEECLKVAQQAVDLCKEIGNTSGEADALRMVIHAHRLRATAALRDGGPGAMNKSHDIFQEAEQLARQELERFKGSNDARGQACMLLAFAEVDEDRRTPAGNFRPSEWSEAMESCREARALFKKAGDPKMEGMTAMLQASISYRMNDQWYGRKEEAQEFTTVALALFRQAGDKKGEAKALHLAGYAHDLRNELEDCIDCSTEALNIYRSMGAWKMEAFELQQMASYYLKARKYREAMSLAEDAYDLYQEHVEDKTIEGPMAETLEIVVQTHHLKGNGKRALRVAEEGVRLFEERDSKKGHSAALVTKANVLAATRDIDAAINCLEQAQAVASELADPRVEGMLLLDLASLHLMKNSYDSAMQAAQDALEIYQEQKDRQGEAFAMNKTNEVNLQKMDWEATTQTSLEQRAIFQELEDKSRAAACYLTVAGVTGFTGSLEEAIPMIHECIEQFQEAYDREGEARCLNFLAELYSDNQDYESAVEKANQMIEILDEYGDRIRQANAYRVLSNIHLKFDKPAQAVRAANEALNLAKKTMDRRAIAEYMLIVSSASVAAVMQDPSSLGRGSEKALRPAREAYKVAKGINDEALMGVALLQVSQVQMMTARHGEAMQAAREAIDIFRKLGDKASEAETVALLAELHMHCMSPEKAMDAANEALAMAEEIGDEQTAMRAKETLHKLQGRARVSIEQVQGMQMGQPMAPEAGAGAAAAAAPAAGVSMEVAKPKGLDPDDVQRTVQEMAKAAIGLEDAVYLDSPLMDSGMDSLTAVSFRNGLQQNLGVKLPSSLMFDYPTMKEVANRIVELSSEDA